MTDISVIIPALNEPYLQNTIDDITAKAAGNIEIIAVLDGYWPDPPLKSQTSLKIAHHGQSKGMRAAINTGARMAKGTYLLKCDAHCCFDKGFDQKLKADCKKPDWVVVPRRYVLDQNTWDRTEKYYEFEYVERETLKGRKWPEFADRVNGQDVCDLMTFQGSCWFMHKGWFVMMGLLDEINFAGMGREAQEISLYTWTGEGRCVLTRNTWYAHWNKPRKHVIPNPEKKKSISAIQKMYPEKKLWPVIEHFAPVPGWEGIESENMRKSEGKKKSKASGYIVDEERRSEGQEDSEGQPSNLLTFSPSAIHEYIRNNYELVKSNAGIKIVGMTRAGMYRLFANLGYTFGCEVGVQRGRNARVMLDNIPNLNLYLVEPYRDHPSNRRKWGQDTHNRFKKQAHNRLKGYPVTWLEGFSEEVSGQCPDKTLDFVYIDGEHTYDFVMIDLILWSRKVHTGGIVSGHDYDYWKPKQPKVARAILDYSKTYNFKPIYMTDRDVRINHGDNSTSWFWIKE